MVGIQVSAQLHHRLFQLTLEYWQTEKAPHLALASTVLGLSANHDGAQTNRTSFHTNCRGQSCNQTPGVLNAPPRSEERRVGKECSSRRSRYHETRTKVK